MLACSLSSSQGSEQFPIPYTARHLAQRSNAAAYLSEHYWENFNFADTLELSNKEMAEQGFVNFIDILSRFNQEIAQKGIAAFTAKAYHTEAIQREDSKASLSIIMRIRSHPCATTGYTPLPGRHG